MVEVMQEALPTPLGLMEFMILGILGSFSYTLNVFIRLH